MVVSKFGEDFFWGGGGDHKVGKGWPGLWFVEKYSDGLGGF